MEPVRLIEVARIEKLDQVIGFAEEFADRCGLDEKRKFGLLVAVEEAFVNVCHYAYPAAEGEVELRCASQGEQLVVEIADAGIPFNVLTLPDPDTTTDLREREIGGLGVYFIRRLTDDVSYRREDGHNILSMVLHSRRGEGGT